MKSEPCLIYHTSKVYFQVDKCHKCGKKMLKHVHNCIEKYPHDFCIKLSLMRQNKQTNKNPLLIMFDCITLEHLCLLKDVTEWKEKSRCLPGFLFVSDSATPWTVARQLLCSGDSPGKSTGVGCHSLLQGIFLTQGLNLHLLGLLHCRWILYCWATRESLAGCYWHQKLR